MKNTLILILMIIFICSIAPNAYSGGGQMKWWKNRDIVAELNLTSDQVNRIESIFSSYKERIIALNSELTQKEGELRRSIANPDATQQEVLALTDQVESIKGELRRLEVKMFLEIREVLSPQQRGKLHQIKERYKK